MEKRNVLQKGRTPKLCDCGKVGCPGCKTRRNLSKEKQADKRPTSIHDVDGLSEMHK